MKLKTVKQRYILAAFIVAVMLIFSIVCGGAVKVRAAAVTSAAVSAYEQRNVWDDLQGATVDGKSIDLTLYNFDEKKITRLTISTLLIKRSLQQFPKIFFINIKHM